ncbi:MAG: PDZ domain-containing protein, partial [Brachybacterium sp.]|nr:PDZ domain-containing protein [Brachybacterium sp.]
AEVVSIEPDSPADESSLRTGDLVISVDDSPVGGAAALTGVVRGLEVGSSHQLEVVRDGTVQSVEITLGVRPT